VLDEQIAQKKTAITRIQEELATARSNLNVSREGKGIIIIWKARGWCRTRGAKKTGGSQQPPGRCQQPDASSWKKANASLSEFEKRRESLADQQRDTEYNELQKIESDLAQAKENLKKRNDRVGRLEVRSPVMGYVERLKDQYHRVGDSRRADADGNRAPSMSN